MIGEVFPPSSPGRPRFANSLLHERVIDNRSSEGRPAESVHIW